MPPCENLFFSLRPQPQVNEELAHFPLVPVFRQFGCAEGSFQLALQRVQSLGVEGPVEIGGGNLFGSLAGDEVRNPREPEVVVQMDEVGFDFSATVVL